MEGLVQTQLPHVVRSPRCRENLAKESSNPLFQDLRQSLARTAHSERSKELSCLKVHNTSCSLKKKKKNKDLKRNKRSMTAVDVGDCGSQQ